MVTKTAKLKVATSRLVAEMVKEFPEMMSMSESKLV